MIRVFSTGAEPKDAGEALNKQFDKWVAEQTTPIKIIGFHTNSNKFGWSLTIHYEKQ